METKIPLYNILNMFLTGSVFLGCILIIYIETIDSFINSDIFLHLMTLPEAVLILISFSMVYEIGLILNRIGSVLIEPFLIKFNLIPFDNHYKLFQEKKKIYRILETLSREYALTRTGIGEFIILVLISFVNCKYILTGVFFCITFVFFLSCNKHTKKIVELMNDE